MQNEKNWYVVNTKPKYEKKVVDLLQKKKLKSYYPRYKQVQYWQHRRKVINVPLFTSLIFVYASEKDLVLIKQTEGVSGVMYWLQKPAIINNIEVSSIRYFLEQHNNIKLEKIQISAGGEVNSERLYPFIQPSGSISFSNVYKVSLPSLGYTLISESVAEEDVKKIVA